MSTPLHVVVESARAGAVLGLLILVAACGATTYGGSSGGDGGAGGSSRGGGATGSTPSSAPPAPAGRTTGALPPAMQPNRVQPDARAVELRPLRWERAEPSGRALTVHFTATGRRDCATLGRVEVAESETSVTVTLLVGRLPGADCDGARPQLAAPATVVANLARDLGGRTVVDGAAPQT